MDISSCIALFALCISILSVVITANFYKKQITHFELEKILGQLLVEKEKKSLIESSKADIRIVVDHYSSGYYRLKITNSGKSEARNLRIQALDDPILITEYERDAKLPYDVLETKETVYLEAVIHDGSPRKQKVLAEWEDDLSSENRKEIVITW